jgi:hypothetical protein
MQGRTLNGSQVWECVGGVVDGQSWPNKPGTCLSWPSSVIGSNRLTTGIHNRIIYYIFVLLVSHSAFIEVEIGETGGRVKMEEITAMREIEKIIEQVDDKKARDRILRWATDKYYSSEDVLGIVERSSAGTKGKQPTKRRPKAKTSSKPARKITINKNLNLEPKEKESFKQFAVSKAPRNRQERCIVSVYYLERVLEHRPIDTSDVYTCFKNAGWRVPADLANALAWTASQKGWLDTSDMSDITVTVQGENAIEHELPRPEVAK